MVENLKISILLNQLNSLYDKEIQIKKHIRILIKEYKQLEQDKELLEIIIMHQYNKNGTK